MADQAAVKEPDDAVGDIAKDEVDNVTQNPAAKPAIDETEGRSPNSTMDVSKESLVPQDDPAGLARVCHSENNVTVSEVSKEQSQGRSNPLQEFSKNVLVSEGVVVSAVPSYANDEQNITPTGNFDLKESLGTENESVSSEVIEKRSPDPAAGTPTCMREPAIVESKEVDVASVVKKLGEIVRSIVPSRDTVSEKGSNEYQRAVSELSAIAVASESNQNDKPPDLEKKSESSVENPHAVDEENLVIKIESSSNLNSPVAGPNSQNSSTPTPRKRGRPKKYDDDTMTYTKKESCLEVMQLLKTQREEGNYCDVIIHVQGCQYWAHRCVLAANSSYFDTILKQNRFAMGSAVEQVTLPSDSRSAFEIVLDYMYTGKLSINLRTVPGLLNLAEKISLEVVKKYCQDHICRNLNTSNWLSIKCLASEYSLSKALKSVYCLILDHEESLSEDDIASLSYEDMADFLGYSSNSTSKAVLGIQETHKLFALLKWVQPKIAQRRDSFEGLLRFIDPLMLNKVYIDKTLKRSEWKSSPLTEEICLKELLNSIKEKQEIKQEDEKGSRAFRAKKVLTVDDDFVWESPVVDNTVRDSKEQSDTEQKTSSSVSTVSEQPAKRKRGRPRKSEALLSPPATQAVVGKRKRGRPRKNENVSIEPSVSDIKIEDLTEDASNEDDFYDDSNAEESFSSKEFDPMYSPHKTKHKRKASNPKRLEVGAPGVDRADKPIQPIKARVALFRCMRPGCKFTSKHKANYEDHINVHEGVRAHTCPVCNKGFFSRKHMRRHKDIHLGHKSHMCECCGYASYRPDKLRNHMQRRHPEAAYERGWISKASYEALKTPKPKGRKRKIFHPGDSQDNDSNSTDGPYKCKRCKLSFPSIRDLDTHRKNHGRSREYLCEDCGFSSTNYKSITIHKKKHKGDVHRCTFGGCTFHTVFKDCYQDHIKRHIGVKEHICSHCGKAYTTRKDMRRHEKTHFDVNMVKCPLCEYSTTRRDNLNDHIRRHHPQTAVEMGMKMTPSSQRNISLRPRGTRKPKQGGRLVRKESTEMPQEEECTEDIVQRSIRLVREQVMLEHQKFKASMAREAMNEENQDLKVEESCEVVISQEPQEIETMVVEQSSDQQMVTMSASGDGQPVLGVNPHNPQQLTWSFWPS